MNLEAFSPNFCNIYTLLSTSQVATLFKPVFFAAVLFGAFSTFSLVNFPFSEIETFILMTRLPEVTAFFYVEQTFKMLFPSTTHFMLPIWHSSFWARKVHLLPKSSSHTLSTSPKLYFLLSKFFPKSAPPIFTSFFISICFRYYFLWFLLCTIVRFRAINLIKKLVTTLLYFFFFTLPFMYGHGVHSSK